MRDFVKREDLALINRKLQCGDDVLIRLKGKNRVQIVSQTVRVLRDKELEVKQN